MNKIIEAGAKAADAQHEYKSTVYQALNRVAARDTFLAMIEAMDRSDVAHFTRSWEHRQSADDVLAFRASLSMLIMEDM